MKKKQNTFVRINSRVSDEQHKFIKTLAKKNKATEGEILRIIIQSYMDNI